MYRKLKVYLDTSVPNAYFDEKNRERQWITKKFWAKLGEFEVFISDLVIDEIKETGDKEKRKNLLNLVKNFKRLSSGSEEITGLAEKYIINGVIP